jgi:hypothetical protein
MSQFHDAPDVSQLHDAPDERRTTVHYTDVGYQMLRAIADLRQAVIDALNTFDLRMAGEGIAPSWLGNSGMAIADEAVDRAIRKVGVWIPNWLQELRRIVSEESPKGP